MYNDMLLNLHQLPPEHDVALASEANEWNKWHPKFCYYAGFRSAVSYVIGGALDPCTVGAWGCARAAIMSVSFRSCLCACTF